MEDVVKTKEQLLKEIAQLRIRNAQLEKSASNSLFRANKEPSNHGEFYTLADQSPNMIFINQNGRVVYANRLCERLTEYTTDEIYAEDFDFRDLILLEDSDKVTENFQLHAKGKEVAPYEIALKTKSGKKVDVIIHTKLITYKDQGAILGIMTDVTERKSAESEIIRISERNSLILSTTLDGYILADSLGNLLDVNPAYCNLIGYSREELLKMNIRDLRKLPPQEAKLRSQRLINQGTDRFETTHKHKNGELLDLDVSYSMVKTEEKPLLAAFVRDITETKKQEIRLKESNLLIESLLQTVPFGLDIVDKQGTVLFINPKMNEIFGQDIVGKKCWEVYREDHVQCEHCPLKSDLKVGESKIIESERIAGGKIFEISHTGMLFNGKEAILEIFFDISERTRKETIQHIVYEIANAVTSTFDLNELYQTIKDLLGTVIDTSNFFIALYEEGIETLSVPFIADEKDSFTSLPLETSLSGYVIRSGKPLLIKKDNKVELMDHEKLETHGTESAVWLGVPLKYHGKITGALVVQSYDNPEAYNESDLRILEYVSHQVGIALERKRAEQELLRAIEKAEESDRLKSAFLANMSHEIRTPMNSILGFSELLKEPDVSNNQKQTYIKVIGESGERMLHTINSLIEISKLEAGETYVAFSNVNIAEVFDYFFALFKPETDKKMLSFSCPNLELASELTISTDQEKLYGILTNLMKNAIKFTNNGSIEFGCQLKDDFVEFYVTDTGIGIAKDKLQIVFERFRQVEKALSRTREGSGLGLAITKANVELLGGSIWVESEEGKGSQFHFTIPNHA